jgi:toxin ParE1/3/4
VKRPVRFAPDARTEAESAARWYARESSVAAGRFVRRLREARNAIAMDPASCPLWDNQYRFILMRPFPYFVVFEVFDDAVEIVAVSHTAREPGYWKDRRGR